MERASNAYDKLWVHRVRVRSFSHFLVKLWDLSGDTNNLSLVRVAKHNRMGTELWVTLLWLPNPHCINESVSQSICQSLCLKYIFVDFADVFVSVSYGHRLKAWALQTLVPLYQPMHNVCYLTPTTQQCGVRVPDDSLLTNHEEYGMVLLAFQMLFDYFKMCVT